MRNRVSLFVVTAAAIALVLTGCGRGPATDTMTEQPPAEEQPMAPSIDGTWVFTGFTAVIAVPDVTVTVGNGTDPLGDQLLSNITQVVAKGTLTMSGTAYRLTLAEGDDAITVTLAPGVPDAAKIVAIETIRTLIRGAQDGDLDITVSDDMTMITVKGSFLGNLGEALGMPVPEEGLVGCKDAACSTMASWSG